MAECFHAVKRNYRYFEAKATQQIGIGFNVYFLERVFTLAACRLNRRFGFLAKMTPGFRVDNHFRHGVIMNSRLDYAVAES